MITVVVGIICLIAGFCSAIFFNLQAYDMGFDDGWESRSIVEKYKEKEKDEF